MKCVVVLFACMLSFGVFGQKPFPVSIGYNKTVSLIFPFAVKSVDRGSKDVIIQKAKGVENILQVKAAFKDFEQTNLSVVTSNGRFYSFLLDYADSPEVLSIHINPVDIKSIITGQVMDEARYDSLAERICGNEGFLRRRSVKQDVRLELKGLYLSEGVIWFQLQLHNKSPIDFTPVSIRLLVRDKKRPKRTAIQETELTPCYPVQLPPVSGKCRRSLTFGIPAFTIPSSKKMIVEIREQNSGRQLDLTIPSRLLQNIKIYNYEKG